jgi:hypothetical protein
MTLSARCAVSARTCSASRTDDLNGRHPEGSVPGQGRTRIYDRMPENRIKTPLLLTKQGRKSINRIVVFR